VANLVETETKWPERKSVNNLRLQSESLEYLGAKRCRERDIPEPEQERIQASIAMIPQDVTTILDVGCGDGRVTRKLSDTYQVVGIDYAFNSVRQLPQRGVRANSAQLPFPDASFDLVLCCELLEHLPGDIFSDTLQELERVARRYILITVPYKENLLLLQTKCPRCSTVFHIWGHLRSFSNRDLWKLFITFREESTSYLGSRPYYSGMIASLNQKFGNRWVEFSDTTMCLTCGNTKSERTGRNLVTIFCGGINLLTSRFMPMCQKNWVLKLYTRR